MATPPFRFKEVPDQVFYHDVRVFIMGYDVTPWLTSAVTINYGGLGGMNNVSLTLSNHNYAFEMTLDNLRGKFRTFDAWTPQGMSSESAKKRIYDLKNGSDDGVDRNIKHKVKSWGPREGLKVGALKEVPVKDESSFPSTTNRFPFIVGSTVFHKNDQIRIFVKNPLTRFYNQWYVAFSGYLTSHVLTRDYVRGESILRIQAQDIRALMQKMRVQSNPAASMANLNAIQVGVPRDGVDGEKVDAGYFNDMVADHAVISHVLGGKTFKDTVNFLILGKNSSDVTTIDTKIGTAMNAVAAFEAGIIMDYHPEKNRKGTLEQFTNVVTFGSDSDALKNFKFPNGNPFNPFNPLANGKFLNWEEMFKLGRESHPWGESSIDRGKVHMLLPDGEHPASNLVSASRTGASITDKISWSSRLELIYEVCNNIDYQMYVSGWGDIIFEFPMYDFSPDDFGPAYEKLYTFEHHTISDTVDDEGGEEVSGIIISSGKLAPELIQADQQGKLPVSNPNELYTTVFSNVLASRIGVNMKTITRLGITDQDALAQFGLLEFNKIVAEYSKYSFVSSFRPYLSINRPIQSVLRHRLGLLDSYSTTWNIRGDVSTSLNLKYVRRKEFLLDKDGKVDLNKGVFRSITGGEATPISYNKIYTDKSLADTGISTTTSGSRNVKNTQEGAK